MIKVEFTFHPGLQEWASGNPQQNLPSPGEIKSTISTYSTYTYKTISEMHLHHGYIDCPQGH